MAYQWERTAAAHKEPVDYVNPNIGTLSWKTWSTSPTVQLPHGMAEVDPVTPPGIGDEYLADRILGFSLGASAIMATAGTLEIDPQANASEFDHDLETASPYFYAVLLEDYGIQAMYTVTEHCIYYRFVFPPSSTAHLLLSAEGLNCNCVPEAHPVIPTPP
jgi:putative alpha-1,2-mannosidase